MCGKLQICMEEYDMTTLYRAKLIQFVDGTCQINSSKILREATQNASITKTIHIVRCCYCFSLHSHSKPLFILNAMNLHRIEKDKDSIFTAFSRIDLVTMKCIS